MAQSLRLQDGTPLRLQDGTSLLVQADAEPVGNFLLLQDGTMLILQGGGYLLLQAAAPTPTPTHGRRVRAAEPNRSITVSA